MNGYITQRMLSLGKVIEIDRLVLEQALAYQTRFDLSLLDAVVYSAVVTDLRRRHDPGLKCLVSKDNKAFFDPEIESELMSHDCRFLFSFEQALTFIQSQLDKKGS